MVGKAPVICERVNRLRALAVVAEWVRLGARVQLDGALEDSGLGIQLLGAVVAVQELSDVHVHREADPPLCAPTNGRPDFPFGFLGAGGRLPKARRGRFYIVQYNNNNNAHREVRREQVLAELLHVRHDLRGAAGCGDRRVDPRRLADRLLTFGNAGRVVADPGKAWKALAEQALLAVVLVLGLELVDDVHAKHLGRRVPARADDLLLVRLRDEDHAGAHVRLRALVLVALEDGRAGRESIFIAVLSSETSVAVRVDVAEAQGDCTPQRLGRTFMRSSAIEFRCAANVSDRSRWRRWRR